MKSPIENRNEEFVRRCVAIFRNDFAEGTVRPLDSIITRALAMQPRSWYISYDTASKRLHAIERHGMDSIVQCHLARCQWEELRKQVDEIIAANPRKTFDAALSFVLNFCRPSRFYISRDTARRLLTPHLTYSLTLKTITS